MIIGLSKMKIVNIKCNLDFTYLKKIKSCRYLHKADGWHWRFLWQKKSHFNSTIHIIMYWEQKNVPLFQQFMYELETCPKDKVTRYGPYCRCTIITTRDKRLWENRTLPITWVKTSRENNFWYFFYFLNCIASI